MSDKEKHSVLVDTSFLITLYDDSRTHHKTAKKYFKYFLGRSITLHLSTIVIAEFHQMQSIIDVVGSGNFIILPYNYEDSMKTADIAYQLGGVERKRDGSNPKYKDDLKLIAQAQCHEIDFIITEDSSTLARYCERLSKAGVLSTKPIILSEGYDESHFNNGQASLLT